MNENTEEHEELEDSNVKRDKIFQNLYDEIELDTGEISFKVDSSFEVKSYEYTLDEKMILEKVENILLDEDRFMRFRNPDDNGNYLKMSKGDINEIYLFVLDKLPKEPRIEIFSVVSSLFDISSDKFYECLSNSFKTELITELKSRGFLSNRNTLF
jgi:hypothetical protein